MNNRQARMFAIVATGLSVAVFLGLTVDSHRQFPALTNAGAIDEAVTRGMGVWHENNCINCHTLFGEGAYYAPDLTKITQHRGEAYLQAYMRDPSQFYDEQRHRRLMPKQDLSDADIGDLITFLDWVSKVDNQGWPPRPILVTGSLGGGAAAAPTKTDAPAGTPTDPRARGERVFRSAQPACTACHSTLPGADMAGPSLAGIGSRAAQTVSAEDYRGSASDAQGYIRESIVQPSAHLVPGAMYSASGTSFMPATYGASMSEEELASLAAYLATLK